MQRIHLRLAAVPLACLAFTFAGCGGGGDSTTATTAGNSASSTGTQTPVVGHANTILSGTTDPGPDVGIDGDFYVNTATWMLFGPKANGVWPRGVSLAGPPGATNAKGNTGATGNTGAAGNTILSGSVDPTDSVGNNGDYYINTSTSTLFGPKADGKWPPGVSLVGPAGPSGSPGAPGADGHTILSGAGAPANSIGTDGDFYLDTNTWTLYGPKANGTWPSGVSLVGSSGGSGSGTGSGGDSSGSSGGHLLSGSGAPANGIGANGDFYLDTSTSTLYGPKTDGEWPTSGVSMTTGTVYNGNFNVPGTLSRGAYVMTGAGGAVPLPSDFGVTIPYDCSRVTLTATALGKPQGKLDISAYKLTGSGVSATAAPVSGLSCKITNGDRNCSAEAPSGTIDHGDKLQVRVDTNQATDWGGLSVNLACTK